MYEVDTHPLFTNGVGTDIFTGRKGYGRVVKDTFDRHGQLNTNGIREVFTCPTAPLGRVEFVIR